MFIFPLLNVIRYLYFSFLFSLYEDICDNLAAFERRRRCPRMLRGYKIPCYCPFRAGNFSVKNLAVNIPKIGGFAGAFVKVRVSIGFFFLLFIFLLAFLVRRLFIIRIVYILYIYGDTINAKCLSGPLIGQWISISSLHFSTFFNAFIEKTKKKKPTILNNDKKSTNCWKCNTKCHFIHPNARDVFWSGSTFNLDCHFGTFKRRCHSSLNCQTSPSGRPCHTNRACCKINNLPTFEK